MNCPACGSADLRDMAWVRSVHVFLCRQCGVTLEQPEQKVILLARPAIAACLVVDAPTPATRTKRGRPRS